MEPRAPSCGATRNQLTPGSGVGLVVGSDGVEVRLGGALGLLRVGAAEQATATTPKLTTATLVRTFILSPACQFQTGKAGSDTTDEHDR